MVYSDFVKCYQNTHFKQIPNLSLSERQALNNFGKNEKIVIRNADKGGGIVVLNRDDYIEEANGLLSYNATYEKLNKDLLVIFKPSLHSMMDDAYKKEVIKWKKVS